MAAMAVVLLAAVWGSTLSYISSLRLRNPQAIMIKAPGSPLPDLVRGAVSRSKKLEPGPPPAERALTPLASGGPGPSKLPSGALPAQKKCVANALPPNTGELYCLLPMVWLLT